MCPSGITWGRSEIVQTGDLLREACSGPCYPVSMVTGVDFDIGSQSAGPAGVEQGTRHVLVLRSGQVAAGIGIALAVIDADEADAAVIQERLTTVFGPGGGFEGTTSGQEHLYLQQLLADVEASIPSAAVAIALQLKSDMIIGVSGGALAAVLSPASSVVIGKLSDARESPLVERADLDSESAVVLAGRAIAARVDEGEIRQTIQGSISVKDAAAWLAMLGASRSGGEATAIVGKALGRRSFAGVPSSGGARNESDRRRRPSFTPIVRVGVAAAVVAVALLIIGATLINHLTANAPTAPTALTVKSSSPQNVVLAWSGSPGSSGYMVVVGGQKHSTRGTTLALHSALNPGTSYPWRVYAVYGKSRGPVSKVSTLTISKGVPSAKPLPVSPPRTIAPPAGANSTSVDFCWKYPVKVSSYKLLISGGGHHYNHQSISPASLKSANNGAKCYPVSLPTGTAYSWRLGAITQGYYPSWTLWQHVQIASGVPPTPTPVPLSGGPTPAPVPTA